jgi:predicted esterase YcpF (UPF0227 family)
MTNRTIVFGSPEAKAVVEADRELRKKEEKEKEANRPRRWYLVSCHEMNIVNYRIKAVSEADAMDRCVEDGEESEFVDCLECDPQEATLDSNQDG